MSDIQIIEPLGPCPITGYPLIAVHETSGVHAGLAIAQIEEITAAKRRHDDGNPVPRLRIEEIATDSEVFRSWAELLIFAMNERVLDTPGDAATDYKQCYDLLQTRHHYDTHRIIASVHIAAMEYLRENKPWAKPELVLLPDVGIDHVRTTAQAAIRRLARGADDGIPDVVDHLRHAYLQRLVAVA